MPTAEEYKGKLEYIERHSGDPVMINYYKTQIKAAQEQQQQSAQFFQNLHSEPLMVVQPTPSIAEYNPITAERKKLRNIQEVLTRYDEEYIFNKLMEMTYEDMCNGALEEL